MYISYIYHHIYIYHIYIYHIYIRFSHLEKGTFYWNHTKCRWYKPISFLWNMMNFHLNQCIIGSKKTSLAAHHDHILSSKDYVCRSKEIRRSQCVDSPEKSEKSPRNPSGPIPIPALQPSLSAFPRPCLGWSPSSRAFPLPWAVESGSLLGMAVDSVQKPGEMAVDSVDSVDSLDSSSQEVHDLMMI